MPRKSESKKESVLHPLYRDPEMVDNDSVAMSAAFLQTHLAIASETRKWSLLQQKLFIMVLCRIKDWRVGNNDNVITLNNYNVMQELGWEYTEENFRKVGSLLKKEFWEMLKTSGILLQDVVTKKWVALNLISKVEGDPKYTRVTLEPEHMRHFENLFYLGTTFGQSFHTILEPDISSFRNRWAYLLFGDIRLRSKVSDHPVEFEIKYSIEDLKRIFEIRDGQYTRKNKDPNKNGKFDFPSFEKRILNPAIDEINCTEQIKILENEDGSFYVKEKRNRYINAYVLRVVVKDLDTIKSERLELQAAAKKAGLNVAFYPNLKESFDVDPEWKGKWLVDENTKSEEEPIENEKPKFKKRNDKLSRDFADAFTVPEALKEDSRN